MTPRCQGAGSQHWPVMTSVPVLSAQKSAMDFVVVAVAGSFGSVGIIRSHVGSDFLRETAVEIIINLGFFAARRHPQPTVYEASSLPPSWPWRNTPAASPAATSPFLEHW